MLVLILINSGGFKITSQLFKSVGFVVRVNTDEIIMRTKILKMINLRFHLIDMLLLYMNENLFQ